MKARLTSVNSPFVKSITMVIVLLSLVGCASIPDIVPQLPPAGSSNSAPTIGADIALANDFLAAGKRRDAAAAYFAAAQNYRSPERERLILQAAELASLVKDLPLTQRYLAPLNFSQLNNENKTRFRLVQAQLALNDRNHRETLRILPQRVNDIPAELGKKVLATRLAAAQGSGDKLSLVQELVLQEPTLKEDYLVNLNHDRIWGHAKQIPAFQLEEAKNGISHPVVKNWLSLAQLSRISTNGPASKRQTLRGDLGSWIQNNSNHPGMLKALDLLNAAPTTTVTPYSVDAPKLVIKSTVVKRPTTKSPVVKKARPKTPTLKTPQVKRPITKNTVKTNVANKAEKKDPSVGLLYENIKKKINKDQ